MLLQAGLGAYFLFALGVSSIALDPLMIQGNTNFSSQNFSTLGASIDENFRIESFHSGKELRRDRICMGAISLVSFLVLRDWSEPQPKEIRDYMDHRVIVSPAAGRSGLETRFAAWGIYLVVAQDLKAEIWQKSLTRLYWHDRHVGSVVLDAPIQGLSDNATNEDAVLSAQDDLDSLNLSARRNRTSLGVEVAKLRIFKLGRPINVVNSYIGLLDCLIYLGPFKNELRLRDFTTQAPGFNAQMRLSTWKPVRTSPPYFEYLDAKIILFRLAVWLRVNLPLEEVGFDITYNENNIGQGFLTEPNDITS